MEADLDAERKHEEERELRREAERQSTRQKQLKERRQRELDEINQMKVSEDERARLLREHEENMARFESNLSREQDRGRAALQAKLEARRAQRQSVSRAKLKRDAIMTDEEAKRRQLLEGQMDPDTQLDTTRKNSAVIAQTGELGGSLPKLLPADDQLYYAL